MRHKPENVPGRVANTSDVVPAPIRVRLGRRLTGLIHVTEHHLSSVFELLQGLVVRVVGAFTMGNRHSQYGTLFGQPSKRGAVVFQLQVNWLAQKQKRAIPD